MERVKVIPFKAERIYCKKILAALRDIFFPFPMMLQVMLAYPFRAFSFKPSM